MNTSPQPFPVAGEPIVQTLVRLRKIGPVVRIELPGKVTSWAVTNYEAVTELLAQDNKLVSRNPKHWAALLDGRVPSNWPLLPLIQGEHLQVLDGADHRRLRALISRAFTPNRVEALVPRIKQRTNELLDAVVAAGDGVDLVAAFTEPLPMAVICELYGVPPQERPALRTWTQTLISHTSSGEAVATAYREMTAYLALLVERKRQKPEDDLTTELVHAHDSGDKLSASELVANLWLMLLAGHETTVHLLGNAIVALCKDPKQRAIALEQNRWSDVVEETLRGRTSVNSSPFRFTVAEVTVAGMKIPAGEAVLTSYFGAGTDPQQYGPSAQEFDITREKKDHVAFGHGPHFCLGAPLARLESRIALSSLFSRLPRLQLAVDFEHVAFSPSFMTYGPLSLPAKLGL